MFASPLIFLNGKPPWAPAPVPAPLEPTLYLDSALQNLGLDQINLYNFVSVGIDQ